MYRNYFPFILMSLFQTGTATAGTQGVGVPDAYAPLAAHYQETRQLPGAHKESSDWYFIRQADHVETTRGDDAEVWQRDGRGELTLTRVFHADRKLIQYTPGELRTQGRLEDWSALNSIVDPRRLTSLKHAGDVSVLGRPAQRYTGTQDGDRIEVLWLTKEALVARLARSGRDGSMVLMLRQLRTTPDTHWPQASLARADRYAILDAADLGDMEYDPFVQHVLGIKNGRGGTHVHHTRP